MNKCNWDNCDYISKKYNLLELATECGIVINNSPCNENCQKLIKKKISILNEISNIGFLLLNQKNFQDPKYFSLPEKTLNNFFQQNLSLFENDIRKISRNHNCYSKKGAQLLLTYLLWFNKIKESPPPLVKYFIKINNDLYITFCFEENYKRIILFDLKNNSFFRTKYLLSENEIIEDDAQFSSSLVKNFLIKENEMINKKFKEIFL